MSVPATAFDPRQRLAQAASLLGMAALGIAAAVAGAALMMFASFFQDWAPLAAIVAVAVPLIVVVVLVNPLVGALVVFLTFPIGSTGAPLPGFTLQAAEGAVIFIAIVVAVRRLAMGRTPFVWSWPLYFALAMFCWMLVTLYGALSQALAIKQTITFLGGIVFACVILTVARSMRDIRWVLGAFVAAVSIIGLIGFSSGKAVQPDTSGATEINNRLSTAFSSPNQLGSVCAMAAIVAAVLMIGTRSFWARSLAFLAFALAVATLALSLSRGAWLGAGLAFLFLLVTLREARRFFLLLSIPLALAGAVIYVFAKPTSPDIKVINERAQAFTKLSPYDNRHDIWREAIREIKAHPVIGGGPGSFAIASTRAGSAASTVQAEHAHDLWLNTAAEQGLPGDVFLAALIVALAVATNEAGRVARARGSPRDRALVIGIAAALVALLGQELVDHTLTNPVVHVAAWGLIGALLAAHAVVTRPTASSGTS